MSDAEEQSALRAFDDNLGRTRRKLIGLMPAPLRDRLLGALKCRRRLDYLAWRRDLLDSVVSGTMADWARHPRDESASCPLCREAASSTFGRDFKAPEDLRRHLDGSGDAAQCLVMAAAESMAEEAMRVRSAAEASAKKPSNGRPA